MKNYKYKKLEDGHFEIIGEKCSLYGNPAISPEIIGSLYCKKHLDKFKGMGRPWDKE